MERQPETEGLEAGFLGLSIYGLLDRVHRAPEPSPVLQPWVREGDMTSTNVDGMFTEGTSGFTKLTREVATLWQI